MAFLEVGRAEGPGPVGVVVEAAWSGAVDSLAMCTYMHMREGV